MKIPDEVLAPHEKAQKETEARINRARAKVYENKRKDMLEYAKANDPHKVGDILEDHYHIIRVEGVSYRANAPAGTVLISYRGPQLTKALEVSKRQRAPYMSYGKVKRKITKKKK